MVLYCRLPLFRCPLADELSATVSVVLVCQFPPAIVLSFLERAHAVLAPKSPLLDPNHAAVYLAAIAEYMAAELLELSGNTARDYGRECIIHSDLLAGMRGDEELVSAACSFWWM